MNKTVIYPDRDAFLDRKDKTTNGVSPEFAKSNPDYEKQNTKNDACWDCSDCSYCSDCSSCSSCSRLHKKKGAKPVEASESTGKSWLDVPVIQNIHQRVLAAVEAPGAFDMGDWHKCETTHCRAGWVVHLAGERGYALEEATNTVFAAMHIYKESSPIKVSPTKFFGKNEPALEDIKRCASEEAKLSAQTS